ncbi:MAG: trypsin-like serine protease, partial [Pseudomonadota bacterium]
MFNTRNCLSVLFSLTLAFFSVTAQAKEDSDKIVGGTAASINDFPWMVYVLIFDAQNPNLGLACGGTLVSAKWVLTAAHCFNNTADTGTDFTAATRTRVTIGSATAGFSQTAGEQIMGAQVIVHPNYQAGPDNNVDTSFDFDIALLELQTPVTNPQVVPLLSSMADALTAGVTLTATGWGVTTTDGSSGTVSSQLLRVDQEYITNAVCQNVLIADNALLGIPANSTISTITDNFICIEGLQADVDTNTSTGPCQGDSGGPLLLPVNNSFVQLGVFSWNRQPCGYPHIPDMYTRVSQFNNFISQNVPGVQFFDLDGTVLIAPVTGLASNSHTANMASNNTSISFNWDMPTDSAIAGFSYVLDNQAETIPPMMAMGDQNMTGSTVDTSTLGGDGMYYFHISAANSSGSISDPVHLGPFAIDTQAPSSSASPAGGNYNDTQNVTLSADETATIFFTTDGSNPTMSSMEYSTPISINSDTTLSFFAVDSANNTETPVNTETYTFMAADTTPPMSSANPAGDTYSEVPLRLHVERGSHRDDADGQRQTERV